MGGGYYKHFLNSSSTGRNVIYLNRESKKVGLKMNLSKTKATSNEHADKEIKMGTQILESVAKYTYLGQEI